MCIKKENFEIEKIKVLIVERIRDPYIKEIEDTLEEKQKIVGGLIDFIELEDDVDLIFNEESKINNLEMNRIIKNDIVCGTFIICGQRNGESISLTDEQIKKYKSYFKLRDHTIPISLLKNYYKESSNLINYDLTGVEKLLRLKDLFDRK